MSLPKELRIIPILFLAGCATTPPPTPVTVTACLPMAVYSPAQEKAAGDALAALPPANPLATFMADYGALRAADRAACGH